VYLEAAAALQAAHVEQARLRTVAQDLYDAFEAWSQTSAVALDDDTLDAMSDLGVALAADTTAVPRETRKEPQP
jgi:hypothetical protein